VTVTINLTNPGFAALVTGVGACIVDALDQTPAGAPCRQCLLVPTSQIVWDNCGPCPGGCDGQVAQAIRGVYGSDTFPASAANLNWAKLSCTPKYWVAEVVVSVTRCLPSISETGEPPSCDEELAAALTLENDRTAVRQAIACCLDDVYTATPQWLAAYALGPSTTLPELGGCGGSETTYLLGVQSCPCG
jgi:hypothetical protein